MKKLFYFLLFLPACQEPAPLDFTNQIIPPAYFLSSQGDRWSFDTATDLAITFGEDSIGNYRYSWITSEQLELSHYATVYRDLSVAQIEPPVVEVLQLESCLEDGFRATWQGMDVVFKR